MTRRAFESIVRIKLGVMLQLLLLEFSKKEVTIELSRVHSAYTKKLPSAALPIFSKVHETFFWMTV